ncbi:multiple epidermal growth factor-like domains protein 11 isoform X2 [Tribolium madens]|uniref:multiple epidermal growth factor-like domains protein 11 isoform X2 n=1 Tax=Tribolium madens TaxID=41895 RepID=UPI001CF73FE0|nr:multiple epidermal growth factor-like domains protein 11 isoform X2 [Tribolium madens]
MLSQFSFVLAILFIGVRSEEPFARQQIQSYVSCRTDADCKKNSFCYGNDDDKYGKCKCNSGYELNNRNASFYECLPRVYLGDACEEDFQCQLVASNLAVCNQFKICDCSPESHKSDKMCFADIKLGEVCMVDQNCLLSDGQYAFCVAGICTCRKDETPSPDRTLCLGSRNLGEPCKSDKECLSVPNTRCLEKCVCDTTYTLSRNETECVKAATKFGDPCDFDGQCSKFLTDSVCNNGACGCLSHLHEYGSRCVRTKQIGQSCEKNEECIYKKEMNGNVRCENKKCMCLFGSNASGDCNIEKILDDNGKSVASGLITTKSLLFGVNILLLFIT